MPTTDDQRARRRARDQKRRDNLTDAQRETQRVRARERREHAAEQKFLGVGVRIGVSSGSPLPVSPRYPTQKSLSAMVANPWVWTAVQAISTDLSGLPLVAVRDGVQDSSHPMLTLLRNPNPQVSGLLFRKQLYADLALCRNAYIRVWRNSDGTPYQLARIHPNAIEALGADDGMVTGWKLTQAGKVLSTAEVLHVSDISWSDDGSVVYGESAIAALHIGIQVDSDVRKQAGRAARRGRLEMLLSPDGPIAAMPEEATRALVEEYQTATEGGRGVYVVGRQIKATPLSLTARDAEFANISDRTRDEILAVFGVPEVRAGKPSANYGTAVQQMRTYWESREHDAALFEAQWSRLAGDGVEIRHSFRKVNALQSANTERLARVASHIANGMEVNEAYAYEGFLDAPLIVPKLAAPAPEPPPVPDATTPHEPKAAILEVLRELGALYASVAIEGEAPPEYLEEHCRARFCSVGIVGAQGQELASLVHESVAQHVAHSATSGVTSLRVFDADHAERIASCLTRSTGQQQQQQTPEPTPAGSPAA